MLYTVDNWNIASDDVEFASFFAFWPLWIILNCLKSFWQHLLFERSVLKYWETERIRLTHDIIAKKTRIGGDQERIDKKTVLFDREKID